MPLTVATAVDWMRRRAENVVAGLLGLMFVAFIIQIVFRYFFNFPIGWTSELSVDHLAVHGAAGLRVLAEGERGSPLRPHFGQPGAAGTARVGLIVAVAAVVLFGMALPATVKYVAFMKVESSSYLKIRLDILYSIYVVFAVAVIVRYLWAIVSLLRGEAPEEADITKASSGL